VDGGLPRRHAFILDRKHGCRANSFNSGLLPHREKNLKFYLPFLAIFIMANIFVFQPWDYDNHKFFSFWLMPSALLMAAALARPAITVEVVGELISRPYVALTLALMARFGVELVERDGRFHYDGQARYRSPGEVYVEGDASSASYFLAAGVLGGGPVRVEGVGRTSLQGDVRFAEALEALGARVAMGENWIEASAPETADCAPSTSISTTFRMRR